MLVESVDERLPPKGRPQGGLDGDRSRRAGVAGWLRLRPTTEWCSRVPGVRVEDRPGSHHPALRFARALSATFVAGAAVVSIVNAVTPFPRGWWLVAYLVLVGGLSQVLLATGQSRLAERALVKPGSSALLWAQVAAWNAGTLTVAAADMAVEPAGVAAGSVVLMAALCLFLAGFRRSPALVGWRYAAYAALLLGLAASVVVGSFLADALPGQQAIRENQR